MRANLNFSYRSTLLLNPVITIKSLGGTMWGLVLGSESRDCYMLGPGPPDKTSNLRLLLYNFRSNKNMSNAASDTNDTNSLSGDFVDIALGSDLDGLSDRDSNEYVEELSDEDDGINVTIKEGIKPNYAHPTPKVASVVVVPEATKRNFTDLIPKQGSQNQAGSSTLSESARSKKKNNRNGFAKKLAGKNKTKDGIKGSAGSLISMLSKVTVVDVEPVRSTPKTPRSPESNNNQNANAAKLVKASAESARNPTATNGPPGNPSYGDVSLRSLDLKVCLADRQLAGKDLPQIREYITGKIEDAVIQRKFVPIVRDSSIGKDGFYVKCSDSLCADWLYSHSDSLVPKINAKIIVIPQDQTVNYVPPSTNVRTVVCVPSRKNNEFILDAFASVKTTLFMRMDKESFEIIKQQNQQINWILEPIGVEVEHQKAKTKFGNQPSGAVKGVPKSGKPDTEPFSSEDMEADPKIVGLICKDGSTSKGDPKPN